MCSTLVGGAEGFRNLHQTIQAYIKCFILTWKTAATLYEKNRKQNITTGSPF